MPETKYHTQSALVPVLGAIAIALFGLNLHKALTMLHSVHAHGYAHAHCGEARIAIPPLPPMPPMPHTASFSIHVAPTAPGAEEDHWQVELREMEIELRALENELRREEKTLQEAHEIVLEDVLCEEHEVMRREADAMRDEVRAIRESTRAVAREAAREARKVRIAIQ